MNVIVLPMTFAGNDTSVCGLTDTLNALPLIGNGVWSTPASNISFADINDPNSAVTSTIEGTFALVWSESVGGTCFADDTVMITFWQVPTSNAGPDQSIDVANTVFAASTPAYGSGLWIIQNPGSTIAIPGDPLSAVTNLVVGSNTFTWSVTNGTCPPANDDVVITVNDVILPEGISPNGDGLNDVWVIGGISTLKNELRIFNRWGETVYETENYQNDWAGTKSNGNELPNDTYFFVLKVEGYEDFTGYIIVNR
jgi:gliding motility-associated-like protein